MIEILEFIFQDFKHFVGTCILLSFMVVGLYGFTPFIVRVENSHAEKEATQ